MEKMSTSLDEQETTFNLYPKASGRISEIYSCVPADMRKIRRYAAQYPDEVKITKEDKYGIFAEAPRDWFVMKPRAHRKMTEEQKQAARERLADVRKKISFEEVLNL